MKSETRHAWSIGVICLFAYSVCYITKNVLGALIPQMQESAPFNIDVLGTMGTVFLICYWCGQLINGQLGNHISPRTMVAVGLTVPGVILIVVPFLTASLPALILWGACGFFCSMLWGPLTRVVGENTDGRVGQVIISLLTAATVVGALIAYVMATVSSTTGNWKAVFLAAGGATILGAVVWFFGYLILERRGVIRRRLKTPVTEAPAAREPVSIGRFLRYGFILMILGMICSGILRNAQSLWIPNMMTKFLGFDKTVGSALSTMMPLFNLLGTFVAIGLLRRFFEKEKAIMGIAFLASVACFGLVFLFHDKAPVVALVALLASCLTITVTNIMVFSGYVMRFRKTGAMSGMSGFFDAFSYAGAGLANIFFTKLMSGENWNRLLMVWMVIGGVGMLAGLIAAVDHKDAPHDDLKGIPEQK